MADYKAMTRQIATEEGVDPELFYRLVNQESRFNPAARSPRGAMGLAQLMPDTAKELGVDPTDPEQNLRGGARYLKKQIADFGSVELGAAAYNAGPVSVRKYKGIPPFAETQHYVKVLTGTEGKPGDANPVQELRAADNALPVQPGAPVITANMAADAFKVGGDKGRDSVLRLEAEGGYRALREEIRPGMLEMINASVMGATDQQILRGIEKQFFREPYVRDPAYKPDMLKLIEETPGMDRDMVEDLKLAKNKQEERDIVSRYTNEQERLAVVGDRGTGMGLALSFAAELTQLSNVAPGLAAYKALAAAKVGSAALAAQGRTGASIASSIGENIISGTAVEAVNQSLNGDFRPADLFMAAGVDSIFGVGFGVAGVRSAAKATAEAAALAHVKKMIDKEFAFAQRAEAELGPEATPEAVRQKINEYHMEEARSSTTDSIADIPAGRKLMSNPEEALPEAGDMQSEDVLSSATRFSNPRETLQAEAAAPNDKAYASFVRHGLDVVDAPDFQTRKNSIEALEDTGGITLHGNTKRSRAFRDVADALEPLRKQFIPEVHLHITNGGTGLEGTTQGGHQIIKRNASMIALKPGTSLSTAVHEFGHAVFAHRLAAASDAQKAQMYGAWRAWSDVYVQEGAAVRAINMRSPIGPTQQPALDGSPTYASGAAKGEFKESLSLVWRQAYETKAKADEFARYYGNFDEFSAEQFVKYIESEVAGMGPGGLTVPQQIMALFSKLIKDALELFGVAKKNHLVRADSSFEDFFVGLLNGNKSEGLPSLEGDFQAMATPSRTAGAPGKSKVVDANGKPLTVYHGTKTLEKLSVDAAGSSTDAGFYGPGLYFTNQRSAAEGYAKGGRVVEANLDIRNPYYTTEQVLDDETLAAIKKAGHDGIISKAAEKQGYIEYVVFKDDQVVELSGAPAAAAPAEPPAKKLTKKQQQVEAQRLKREEKEAARQKAKADAEAARKAASGPTAADSVNQIMTDPVAIKYGIDSLPVGTPAERAAAKEILALYKKADAFAIKHPMDAAYLKRVDNLADNSLFNVASTGLTMLKSQNPLVRMVAFELLEDASGASGVRQSTAAISKFMHERLIQGNAINDVSRAYDNWKVSNGGSLKDDMVGGSKHDQFNRLVAEEIEARRKTAEGAVTKDANVAAAADSLEAAYTRAAKAQIQNKTLGWAALPPTSRGYMPHRMSAKRVAALTNQQRRVVQDALVDQFITIEKWDMSFADELAAKYLERVRERASGGYSAPMGGGSGAAAEIVEDALNSMNLTKTEIREHMQRYTRGAANFTKSRLDLDLNRVYDVDGQPFKLMDVFETDQVTLLRSQAQRASGEIALARHGVYGKPGLDLLRKAMQLGEDGKRTHIRELEAFDQVSAEFLGAPFGNSGGKWMERAMAANGAARLGGVVFNQLSETINGIFHVGAGRALESLTSIKRLREEILALSRGEKVDNPFLTSIEASGGAEFGTDSYKMVMPFDSPDHAYPTYGKDALTLTDRILRGASHAQSVFSGFRMVHSAQQRGMAEQIVHKMMRYVRDGGEDVALEQFGITKEIQAAMRKDLSKIATWEGDRLMRFDVTQISDPDVREAVIQSVHRGVRQIIQGTFIGETGKWAHDGWLKLLTQFRTFSITSMEKQWGRQRNSRGNMEALGMVVGSLAMAMPIYMARTYVNSIGRSDQAEYLEERLAPQMIARATMNYIAMGGMAGDFVDLVSSVLPEELGVAPTGGRAGVQSDFVGNYVLPASSLVDDIWKYAQGPTDLKAAARILPGSRVPYLLPFVNALGD